MTGVEIYGWTPGFNKVECDKLITSAICIGLKQAKDIVDSVLNGNTETVYISSIDDAQSFVAALRGVGANARVVLAHRK